MKIFSPLYQRVLRWSRHPKASRYLCALSFAESSFFPIPPDVMLAPMSLASPARAYRLATMTTIASVVGGLFGYAIGSFAFEAIEPMLRDSSYWASYQAATEWFHRWGVWAIFVAGFSPIPYKVFTIAAGTLAMPVMPFTLASFVGRGARFFLVAALMKRGGAKMEAVLYRYVNRLGWAMVALVGVGAYFFSR